MAEISFNNKFDQMNKLNQQFYDDYFEDNYDPTKPMDQQSNSLTMKSLNDGSTTPDFAAMQSAYNDAQNSKTKNSFFSMSADASMPDNFSGLQNSMGGLTLNPDGTLNYNNTQPQNLGFTSMVDMANKANNFNSQFASPGRFSGMGQVGPNKSNMNAPAALDMGRFAGVSNLGRNDMDVEQVESLTSPQGILQGLQDKIGAGFNNVKDFAIDKGNMGRNLLGSAGAMAMGLPGMVGSGLMSLLSNLRDPNAPSYQTRSPNIDYSNLNTNNLNDFYDSNEDSETFGTTRFDRAKPGSFGSYRTLADYFNRNKTATAAITKRKAKKEAAAQKSALASQLQKAQQEIAAKGYKDYGQGAADGSGGYNQGDGGSYSGSSTQDYGGGEKDGGMIGYRNGGLASMFTRRR